jgi:protein involved in polysaccharide export with SLBB domain
MTCRTHLDIQLRSGYHPPLVAISVAGEGFAMLACSLVCAVAATVMFAELPELPPPCPAGVPDVARFERRPLPYIIEPPDVLRITISPSGGNRTRYPIAGIYRVRPDGNILLGRYGEVFVAGLFVDQAKFQVARCVTKVECEEKVREEAEKRLIARMTIDGAEHSRGYHIVVDDVSGERTYRQAVTPNCTVLDAIRQVEGLPELAGKAWVWVERSTGEVLEVDWLAVTRTGSPATNYEINGGDRLYVRTPRSPTP